MTFLPDVFGLPPGILPLQKHMDTLLVLAIFLFSAIDNHVLFYLSAHK